MGSALPPANSCVDTTCEDQITVQVPGPAGADGSDGSNGSDGENAWTTLTAGFTMPAELGEDTASVTSSDWMAYGQIVVLGDLAGTQYAFMQVTDKPDSTSVTLKNLEDTPNGTYADNVAAGVVLPVGTVVSPSGLQGVDGTDGVSGADKDGHYVVTQSANAPVNATDLGDESNGTYFIKNVVGGSVAVLTNEDAATFRGSLGLGTIATQAANSVAITGGSITGITDLAVADGGTGASTAAGARTNLGLGTISTQDANNVTISGGSVSGITDLAIADGGTGASDAATARANLSVYSQSELTHVHQGTVVLLDKQATTTDGGDFTAGAWRTRELNTEAYDDMNVCSLAANQFTLDEGSYYLTAFCPAHKVNAHQARLYNVSTASVVTNGYGTNADSASTGDDVTMSVIHVAFTVPAGGQTFEIQHYCETTKATDGFGAANSFGGDEVYTKVIIAGEK